MSLDKGLIVDLGCIITRLCWSKKDDNLLIIEFFLLGETSEDTEQEENSSTQNVKLS